MVDHSLLRNGNKVLVDNQPYLIIDTDFDGVPDSIAQNPYAFQQLRDPIGGNFLVEGSLQLIFKLPMIEDQRSMRSAFFLDFGNVFSTDCQEYQINWL